MIPKTRFTTLLLLTPLLLTPVIPASAQNMAPARSQPQNVSQSFRSGTREFFVTFQWFTAPTLVAHDVFIPDLGTNDVVMNINGKDLYGLGFGWNIDEHWNIWGDMSFGSPKFQAEFGDRELHGRGNVWMGRLNVDYNLLDRPLTPYVTAGLGFTFFDSRVPSGDTEIWCWWDWWWGYVCSESTPTHSKTSFSPNLGVGVRYDVNDMFFLKGEVNWTWVSIGAGGSEPYTQYRVNMGWGF